MGKRLDHSGTVGAISAMLLLVVGCQRGPTLRPQQQPPATSPNPPAGNLLSKREPIYFIKGDASLSPGAIAKLKTWVETWGVKGKWTLGCPTGPGLPYELLERRLQAIRNELRKFGVVKVDTLLLPSDPAGPYDAIYVEMGPS